MAGTLKDRMVVVEETREASEANVEKVVEAFEEETEEAFEEVIVEAIDEVTAEEIEVVIEEAVAEASWEISAVLETVARPQGEDVVSLQTTVDIRQLGELA